MGRVARARHEPRLPFVTGCALAGRCATRVGIVTDGAPATVTGTPSSEGAHLPLMTGCTRLGVGSIGVWVVASRATRVSRTGTLLVALATGPLLGLGSMPGVAVGAVFVFLGVPG